MILTIIQRRNKSNLYNLTNMNRHYSDYIQMHINSNRGLRYGWIPMLLQVVVVNLLVHLLHEHCVSLILAFSQSFFHPQSINQS